MKTTWPQFRDAAITVFLVLALPVCARSSWKVVPSPNPRVATTSPLMSLPPGSPHDDQPTARWLHSDPQCLPECTQPVAGGNRTLCRHKWVFTVLPSRGHIFLG